MRPYLDPWHRIPMYGFMIAIGLVFIILLSLFYRDTKLKRDDALYATTFAMIGGFAGAKLLSLFQNIPAMIQGKLSFLAVLMGGYVFYGGFIGGIVGLVVYGLIFRVELFELLDLAALRVPVGQAFGRLGCLCAGCCYGKPTDMPWGIVYPESNTLSTVPKGIPLHPTQIYETIYCLLIFVVLIILTCKPMRGKIHKGVVSTVYVSAYAVCRSINEIFRYDEERKFVGAVSTSQFISILLIIAVIGVWVAYLLVRKYKPDFIERWNKFFTPKPPKKKAQLAAATPDGAVVATDATVAVNTDAAEATIAENPETNPEVTPAPAAPTDTVVAETDQNSELTNK